MHSPPDIVVDEPGTYTLTLTNRRNGCSTTKSVYVGRLYSAIASEFAGDDKNIHYNRFVELNSEVPIPVVRYSWSPAEFIHGPTNTESIVTRRLEGSVVFTLEVEDEFGCTYTDEVKVNVISHPTKATSLELKLLLNHLPKQLNLFNDQLLNLFKAGHCL